MPVSVVGGPIGDCAGQTSGGDTCPWLVDGASGVGVVVSAGTGPGGAPAQLLNGGLIEPHYPSRTPLLTGNPGSSISSSAVMIKPIRPMGGSSYHSNGLNSIGSGVIIGGSTVVRGSEGVGVGGGGGGGASYTAALASSGGGTMFPPASCSAPPGGGPDLGITSSGSGSGAGQPLLVERTVARQVHLERRIGEGRYGDVWLGRLHCDQVAVKIFSSRNENSWIREKEIYETATLRHTNILGFIAADNKDNGISTELWLIAEYHRLGSLYEFLQSHAFSLPALVKMASSIANGLAHLHMPIIGTSGKPQIAHRDLKSRNILVKGDGECCIGDLGFAVKLDSLTGQVDVAHNPERVGTKRYMAPEVLDNTLRANSFDAYMQADIYSLGLVFWEMTRRVYVPDLYGPEEYQLPYQDYVGSDPLVEEMKSVVCELGLRPHLPLVWQKDSTLRMLYHIMTECWFATPSDRLSAMRIKKDLGNQRQQLGPPGQASDSVLPPHILRQQSPSHVLPPGVFLFRSPEPTPSSPATTTAAATAKQATPSTVDGLQPATPLLTSVQPPNVIAATQPN
uniref:receptor protein serine/threonine kinase n=1 Tax=Mesocestoides corti TaxID=53468 RepID=A0A5K3FL72_MESCO